VTGPKDKIIVDRRMEGRLLLLIRSNPSGGQKVPFLRVPERHREAIKLLGDLDDESFSELYRILKEAPQNSQSEDDLTSRIGIVPKLDAAQISKVVRALVSLYRVRTKQEISAEQLTSELYDVIREEGRNVVTPQKAPVFKSRLSQLLSLTALDVIFSKASELQLESERLLCESRILTDLRPVFGSSPSAQPKAMVIVHTLKLVYHELGEHKEIYISLDSEDIAKLKQCLERAEVKARTLEEMLKAAGIKSADLS
jgi:hypothetical protein